MHQKLAELMDEKGFSDKQIASALGCAVTTVVSWRVGTYLPRADYVVKLCRILNCNADELLGTDLEQPVRVNKALAVDLNQAVTMKGKFSSDDIHSMASVIKRVCGGKLTQFEIWLREIAEALYKIEIMQKPKLELIEVVQLKLPGI